MTVDGDRTTQGQPGPNPRFDELFAGSAGLVRSGRHTRDDVPVEGGRWPVSLVLRLPSTAVRRVAALTEEAAACAGPAHFRTGHPEASHITVRALEPYRAAAAPHDTAVRRWTRVAAAVAARTPPLPFRLTGVTLAPNAVMSTLEPVGDEPWALLRGVAAELGPDGWFEADVVRSIFYTNLLHFTGDLDDADALVGWVARNRTVEPLTFTARTLEVVRYRHVDRPGLRCMAVERWAGFALAGRPRG